MEQEVIDAVARELERREVEGVANEGEPGEDEIGPTSGLTVFNVDIRCHMKYLVGVAWESGEPSFVFASNVPANSTDVEGIADWIMTVCDYLDTDDYHNAVLSGGSKLTYQPPPYLTPEERQTQKSSMILQYGIGSKYPLPDPTPPVDSVALFIEAIPVFKIWYAPPLDFEHDALAGTCTHIGLVPHKRFPGGIPLFLFRHNAGGQMLVRAPLIATDEQVQRWCKDDSNGFMFLLIEHPTRIIRQIRTLGVTPDFRHALADAWSSVKHPTDTAIVQKVSSMADQAVVDAADLWAYNPDTDLFERKRAHHVQ